MSRRAIDLHSRLCAMVDAARSPIAGRLAVAVSGGGDSMALLHLLLAAGWPSARLVVLNVDHAIRPESAQESTFVADCAAAVNVEFRGQRLSLTAGARHAPDVLRTARHRALRALAADCQAIALAHTLDDQRETRWLALARGAGLAGLAGMRAWSPPLWRPLLEAGRDELRDWLRARGIPWRDDPSNLDFHHPRVRLRHVLIPSIGRALGDEALRVRVLQDEDAWLQQQARRTLDTLRAGPALDRAGLASIGRALARRVVRLWLPRPADVERTEALLDVALRPASRLRSVEMPGGYRVWIGSHWLIDDVDLPQVPTPWGQGGPTRPWGRIGLLHLVTGDVGIEVRRGAPLEAAAQPAGESAELRAIWPWWRRQNGPWQPAVREGADASAGVQFVLR